MALILDQFLEKYGVKSSSHLSNPRVVQQARTPWFRMSIIHYLDIDSASKFPNRNMYQLREMDASKKIPVHHLSDMFYHDGCGPIIDRYIPNQIKKWETSHVKTFRTKDLIEEPTKDLHIASIVNHNPYKDKYGYVSARTEFVNKHYNYLKTFADVLATHVKGRPDFYHVVSINIPAIIPGFKAIMKLTTYDTARLGLVVDDPHLFWFFEIYKWNSTHLRSKSIFKNITDNDAKSIIIEFKSKGFSSFVPLYVLRGLSKDSSLSSNIKVDDIKSTKYLSLLLLKIQGIIEEQVQGAYVPEVKLKDDSDPEGYVDGDSEVLVETGEEQPEVEREEVIDIEGIGKKTKVKTKVIKEAKPEIEDEFINGMIGNDLFSDIDSFDDMGSESFVVQEDKLSSLKSKPKKEIKFKEIPIEKEEEDKDKQEAEENNDNEEELEMEVLTQEEKERLLKSTDLNEKIEEFIELGKETLTITSSEITSLRNTQLKRKRLKDPFSDKLVDEVTNNRIELPDLNGDYSKLDVSVDLVSDDLKKDKIKAFDKFYLKEMMNDDIVKSITNIEQAGIIITDYQVEDVKTVADNYQLHRISLKPIKGKPSTVYLKLPIVDDQSTFMANGIKYRLRKSEQDLPIRKVGPDRVSLQSNYGKIFVNRTERAAYNRNLYIDKQIRISYMEGTGSITGIVPGVKHLNLSENLPNDYFALASNFDVVETGTLKLIFTEDGKKEVLKEELIKKLDGEREKHIFIGLIKDSADVLVLDMNNNLINYTNKENLGQLTTHLGLDGSKIPKGFSSIKLMGKELPLGVAMSYYIGISNLIRLMDIKYAIFPKNARSIMQDVSSPENLLMLRFDDYKLYLDLDTEEKRLLFNGFLYFKDFIKNYKLKAFDNRNIYLNLVEVRKMGLFHLKELDNLLSLFIDPITKRVLEEMGEPTEFKPLLLRANEMLADYSHKDVNDPHLCRIRGYDRFAGLTYRVLVESVRKHNLSGNKNTPISLDPYAVWNTITQDNSIKTRDVINPIATMKEDTIVTLTGVDGLSSDAVPVALRRYHKNDVGLISEGTIDSKNVGLAMYASPYMNVENSLGMVSKDKQEFKDNPGKIFSCAVQLSPFSEYDDQNGSP